ncbi:MAG: MFS transporter [Candidatus Paceibacterota bacterium]
MIKLKNIFFIGFLFSLHLALTAFVNSSFLSTLLKEEKVGFVYTLGFLISIVILLLIPKMLSRIGNYKFLLLAVGLNAFALLSLSVFKSIFLIIPIFMSYLILNIMIIFSLDELLSMSSKNSSIGKIRGFYIMIISLAWVIAPSISGAILSNFSFSILYFISSLLMTSVLIISFFSFKSLEDPKYDKTPILESLQIFSKNKNLVRAYKINFLLQFFYAFMVIYTPIYLNAHLGFSWTEIGGMFTIMLTPFVILPFFVGKYSDRVGERKMLIFGFMVTSLATLSLFFIKQPQFWIWALLLFTTRIGASTIETMIDTYFFKHITPENDEFVSIYRNTTPIAYITAPLVVFLVFALTPSFNFIYPILSAFMLYGIYLAATIKKSDI